MRLLHRRLALIAAVLAFCILSPLVILYAMGYRWPSIAQEPRAVGVLLVESVPSRAQITLNGQPAGSTPHAATNLSPGLIDVTITARGYQLWQKLLPISASQITEARAIRLFPAQPQRERLFADATMYSLSPNRRTIAVVRGRQLLISDIGGQIIVPPQPVSSPQALLWSPDSNYLVITQTTGRSLLSVSAGSIRPLSQLANVDAIAWDPRVPGRLLALGSDRTLFALHVATSQTQILARGGTAFAVSSRHIFLTDQQNLRVLTLQGDTYDILPLPAELSMQQLYVTPQGQVTVQAADGTVYLLTEGKQWLRLPVRARRLGWSPNGQLLYLQSEPNTVHVYNAADERQAAVPLREVRLVIRLSRPIRDVQWFAGGAHLIYQVDDEIIISEIDTRDHPATYTLAATNLGNSSPAVGEDGAHVLYLNRSPSGNSALMSASLIVN